MDDNGVGDPRERELEDFVPPLLVRKLLGSEDQGGKSVATTHRPGLHAMGLALASPS